MMTAEELAGLKAMAENAIRMGWAITTPNPPALLRLVEQAGRVEGLEKECQSLSNLVAQLDKVLAEMEASQLDAPAPPEVSVEQLAEVRNDAIGHAANIAITLTKIPGDIMGQPNDSMLSIADAGQRIAAAIRALASLQCNEVMWQIRDARAAIAMHQSVSNRGEVSDSEIKRIAYSHRIGSEVAVKFARDLLAAAESVPTSDLDFPAGAMHNAEAFCTRLENIYDFQCEAGPLGNCYEWTELRRCISAMADYISATKPAASEAVGERAMFEAETPGLNHQRVSDDDSDSSYRSRVVEDLWQGWEMRAQLAAPTASTKETK